MTGARLRRLNEQALAAGCLCIPLLPLESWYDPATLYAVHYALPIVPGRWYRLIIQHGGGASMLDVPFEEYNKISFIIDKGDQSMPTKNDIAKGYADNAVDIDFYCTGPARVAPVAGTELGGLTIEAAQIEIGRRFDNPSPPDQDKRDWFTRLRIYARQAGQPDAPLMAIMWSPGYKTGFMEQIALTDIDAEEIVGHITPEVALQFIDRVPVVQYKMDVTSADAIPLTDEMVAAARLDGAWPAPLLHRLAVERAARAKQREAEMQAQRDQWAAEDRAVIAAANTPAE